MILIIDENRGRRETLAETFYYMGILSYPLGSEAALTEVSPDYRAILLSEPMALASPIEYIRTLNSLCANIPIVAVSEEQLPPHIAKEVDLEIRSGIYSSELAGKIIELQNRRNISPLGSYMLAGLDASLDAGGVKYFSKKVTLTKTEAMIIRYLMLSYPKPKSAQLILSHAYKPTKLPEDAAVRTQISLINRKFSKLKEERLIARTDTGYVILTPELLEKQKI